ncbi:hypothetical protein AB0L40_07610 [Patulibacter sp. NPDC049589]
MLEERQADATYRRLVGMFVSAVGGVVVMMATIVVIAIAEWK